MKLALFQCRKPVVLEVTLCDELLATYHGCLSKTIGVGFHRMIIALIFSIILIGCDQNPETPPLPEETQVSGIIDADTIWTEEHSPYIGTDDISERSGEDLSDSGT